VFFLLSPFEVFVGSGKTFTDLLPTGLFELFNTRIL